MHKNIGHFDEHDYSIAAFYGSDYLSQRREVIQKESLISLFLGYSNLHIIRAVDPELNIWYHERICDPRLSEKNYGNCLASKREGLASKAQLAYLILQQNELTASDSLLAT